MRDIFCHYDFDKKKDGGEPSLAWSTLSEILLFRFAADFADGKTRAVLQFILADVYE